MSTLTTGKYSNVETVVYYYLMNNGFSLAQTCGILANIEKESSFNPTTVNVGEGAYGLCQWRLSRRIDLHKRYGQNPSAKDQVHFILDEFKTTETKAYKYFTGSDVTNTRSGAQAAAHYFAKYYERCAQVHIIARVNRAKDYWDHYSNERPDTTMVPSTDLKFTESSPSDIVYDTKIPATRDLINVNPYAQDIVNNLSRVTAAGFDYGYLIDVVTGDEFKFYIPEFSESAGSNWVNIDIPGRSVSIVSYTSTNSRIVSISLELFAGEGLYKSDSDVVGKLHRDANFVKSLEYPDYSTVMVNPPHTVQLILGSAMSISGIVKDVNVEHKKPLDSQNRAMYLRLSFSVVQVSNDPPGVHEIRGSHVAMENKIFASR